MLKLLIGELTFVSIFLNKSNKILFLLEDR